MLFLVTALIAFAGSFVQSSSGFGYAIVCMALWPLLMPFRTASILEAVTAFFMVVYITARLFRHIDWKLLLPPACVAGVFSLLGVNTLMALSETAMHKILGVALLVLAVYFIFFSARVHLHPTLLTGMAAGMAGGFCGGLFNIGGPPMVAYFFSVTDDKLKYNATLQAFFCVNTITIFCIHLVKGNLTADMLPLGAAALCGTALGTISGFLLFRKLTMKGIKKIIYTFMVCAGFYMVLFG